jgi:hypothetical protein
MKRLHKIVTFTYKFLSITTTHSDLTLCINFVYVWRFLGLRIFLNTFQAMSIVGQWQWQGWGQEHFMIIIQRH